jgi:hypothetical protein
LDIDDGVCAFELAAQTYDLAALRFAAALLREHSIGFGSTPLRRKRRTLGLAPLRTLGRKL